VADDAPPPGHSGRSGRSPRDYRPDLRPMLILLGLLLAVVVAWLFISPLILPAT
jgi:hypothetical protein